MAVPNSPLQSGLAMAGLLNWDTGVYFHRNTWLHHGKLRAKSAESLHMGKARYATDSVTSIKSQSHPEPQPLRKENPELGVVMNRFESWGLIWGDITELVNTCNM